jgi:hypothetical protein
MPSIVTFACAITVRSESAMSASLHVVRDPDDRRTGARGEVIGRHGSGGSPKAGNRSGTSASENRGPGRAARSSKQALVAMR